MSFFSCIIKVKHNIYLPIFSLFAQIQFNTSIANIWVDNVGEFFSMREFFKEKGTNYQHSCINNPQQNEVFECKHRYIIESHKPSISCPSSFMFVAECIFVAVHIMNSLPHQFFLVKLLSNTFVARFLLTLILRFFGYLAYATDVHVPH